MSKWSWERIWVKGQAEEFRRGRWRNSSTATQDCSRAVRVHEVRIEGIRDSGELDMSRISPNASPLQPKMENQNGCILKWTENGDQYVFGPYVFQSIYKWKWKCNGPKGLTKRALKHYLLLFG